MSSKTKVTAKWLSLIFMVMFLVCFTTAGVFAAEVNSAERPEGVNLLNTEAPKAQAADPGVFNAKEAGPSIDPQVPDQNGYVNNPWKVYLKNFEQGGEGYVTPKVLIIEDSDSWATGYQNEAALNNLGIYYDIIISDQISSTDLYGYTHILIPSDQPQAYYENLDISMASITDWVYDGGSLQFNACDQGWNSGSWNYGPGGITHVASYVNQNHIQDLNHPILQGMTDDDFYGWGWVSHGYFENLPEDTHVLLSEEPDGSRPTLVEFKIGDGHVVASQNTLEYAVGYGYNQEYLTNIIDYMFKQGFDTLEWSVSDVDSSLMDISINVDKDIMFVDPYEIGNDDVLLTLTDTATGLTAEQLINIDIQEDTVPPELWVEDLPQYTTSGWIGVDGETEPGAIVLINNEPVEVDKFGNFYGEVSLEEGDNIIVVEASDASGNTEIVKKNVIKDTEAPEVSNVLVTPDYAYVDDSVKVSADVYDSLSGVNYVQAYLASPSGNQLKNFYLYSDPNSDSWTGSIYVDNSMEPGIWTINSIYASDNAGNGETFYPTGVTFEVENPNFDNVPPVVNSIEVTPQIVKQGKYIHVSVDAYDEKNDIGGMYGYFYNYEAGYSLSFYPSYNADTGKWEVDVYIPEYYPNGTYNLDYLQVYDNAGNWGYYYSDDLEDFPNAFFKVSEMATLILNPEYEKVQPDEQFTVNVDIENAINLYGADVRIAYDSSMLQVVDANPDLEGTQVDLNGVVSGLTVKNQVQGGEIWFSTSKNGDIDPYGFTGSGTIATITFQALENANGNTCIDFVGTQLSDDADPPAAIPHDYQNAELYISGNGNIEGFVKLQGLPDYNYCDAKVTLEGTGIFTYTDCEGYFSLTNITPGQYTLVVEKPEWKPVFLTQGVFEVYVDGNQTTDVGTIKLLTGDINSDNAIGVPDLGALAQSYAAFEWDPNYNYNADLNENWQVDLFDMVLMAKNWNKQGYGHEFLDYGISGEVWSDYGPVPYASVKISKIGDVEPYLMFNANEYGNFEAFVEPGTYEVSADEEGYQPDYVTVNVDQQNPWPFVELYLGTHNPMGIIEGVVKDALGNPIPDAVVTVSGGEQTNGVFLAGYTDNNGFYCFDHVNIYDVNGYPIEMFTVAASKWGYAHGNFDVTLMEDEIKIVDFTLEEVVMPEPTYNYDFETEQGWEATGFWHELQNGSEIYNTAVPDYVTLPDGDLTDGYVPDTPFGNVAFWYGQDATGNFIGEQSPNDYPLSGGTSLMENSGDLISPVIDLAAMENPVLQFQSWWEIEGVNPNESGFDLMTVSAYSVTEDVYYDLGRLNPWVDPYEEDREHLAFTSGGFNRPGVWVPYTFDLTQFAGQQIKLQFNFDTRDELYNGFRGWLIDEVGIYNMDVPAEGGIFGQSSVVPKENLQERH